jgi:1,2-diacylglycerol 3-beta-galactosyltransferase
MEVWMRAADILVTKAGPNTLSEAFIAGLPIVIYTAVPGQEEGNITHVVNHKAGLWAPQPKVTAKAVEHLIKNPSILLKMSKHSQALAKPNASKEIAIKLWELVSTPKEMSIPEKNIHLHLPTENSKESTQYSPR